MLWEITCLIATLFAFLCYLLISHAACTLQVILWLNADEMFLCCYRDYLHIQSLSLTFTYVFLFLCSFSLLSLTHHNSAAVC
ncbi:hypothetical protein I7I48_10631 [Histoplasma ohiense]|nr:hypothetical protein I7I48_10631 [Histoplasma ohiense (nom. inval.)]